MAIDSRPAETDRRFRPPVMQGDIALCPRCGSRLQRDYDALSCVACGYAFEPEGRAQTLRRALSAPLRKAAGLAPLTPVLTRGLDPMVGVMALVVAAVVVLTLSMKGRSRPGRRNRTP